MTCEHKKVHIINSRPNTEGRRRRYECISCGFRYTTMEVVIKKKGLKGGRTAYRALKEENGLTNSEAQAFIEIQQIIKNLNGKDDEN